MTELESTMGKAPGLTPNTKRKKKKERKQRKASLGAE